MRRRVDPKEDTNKNKQDKATARIPNTVLKRRQKRKENTYEHEIEWQFKPIKSDCWVKKELLVNTGYLKLEGARMNARPPWPAW